MPHAKARLVLLLPWLALGAGCESYAEITSGARDSYYRGEYELSVGFWSDLLAGQGRAKDSPLVLLERGMVHLAMGQHAEAARDFLTADRQLEIIDFTQDPKELGKYLFSEDSGVYRGPPHEKILIPTLNALNYAALGDAGRARTAANQAYSQLERFAKLEKDVKVDSPLALILLGLMEEGRGDTQRACIAYQKAYRVAGLPSLQPILLRLLAHNAKSDGGHWRGKYEEKRRLWPDVRVRERGPNDGELIVVVLHGRAPVRRPVDIHLDRRERNRLVQSAVAELLLRNQHADVAAARVEFQKVFHMPMAVFAPRPSRYAGATVSVRGGPATRMEEVLPLEQQVMAWYEARRNGIYAAAFARLAFRMAAQVATYLALRKDAEDNPFAMLVALATGSVLQALDTPDTRCWTLLPRAILYHRRTVPAGQHDIEVAMTGQGNAGPPIRRSLEVSAGKNTVVVLVVPD